MTQPMDASKPNSVMLPKAPLTDWPKPKHKAFLVPQTVGGSPVSLDSPQLVFGRGSRTDCRISDPSASRRHARILAIHDRYYVQDLGSANGTIVNRDRVTHADLSHGDLVTFGTTVFRLVVTARPDTDYLGKLDLGALTSLADAVEEINSCVRGHSAAVARVAQQLAWELGFSPAAAELVHTGCRLLDIGTIGIPKAVLCKKGPLDPSELTLMHQHPGFGEAILAPLESFADVLPIVRQHHERFDGRGYPDGLAGEDIVVGARIAHVADAYYSMASARPYRKPLYQEFIRMELTKGAGSQFDPEITRAFLSILPSMPRLLTTAD